MNVNFRTSIVFICIGLFALLLTLTVILHHSWAEPNGAIRVGVLAGDLKSEQEQLILSAYEQILKEEGFPYQVVTPGELVSSSGEIQINYDALIVPEVINATMQDSLAQAISAYVRNYGHDVLLVLDPATRTDGGESRQAGLLSELAGVSYYQQAPEGQQATYSGFWYFSSAEKGREWGITPGKLDGDHAVSSYSYGKLNFEHARAVNKDANIVAFDRVDGTDVPVIAEKQYTGGGTVVYANLPLGMYKLRSDDLTIRSVLRSFLIKKAQLPRLVNSPGGAGGLVFNLHVCSGAYFKALTVMLTQGIFQKEIPFSIHITAGPDTYKLGDQMGFSAENEFEGRPLLEMLQDYGEIGSHGGWMHNFFAYNMQYLPQDRAVELIRWNSEALEAVTGKKVVEYSAPGGNHPYWVEQTLEEMGVKAYYFAGDTGSSPTQTLLEGKPTGGKTWSFPITPYRQFASLEEMERGQVPLAEVKQWLQELTEFAAQERAIRMVYTHPSEVSYELDAMQALEDKMLAEQRKDRLRVAPMSQFADFLNRHAATKCQVGKLEGNGYVIDLENPEGLKDMTVAVYVGTENKYVVIGEYITTIQEDDGWLYLTVNSNEKEKHLEVYQI
ncbi:MAG: polysaccharide deacetylase family protein [Desulfotomaculaceae bacterium]|nr:polysaccharide deacetylase family protein [Desulfotomaculaceae bacterium]